MTEEKEQSWWDEIRKTSRDIYRVAKDNAGTIISLATSMSVIATVVMMNKDEPIETPNDFTEERLSQLEDKVRELEIERYDGGDDRTFAGEEWGHRD